MEYRKSILIVEDDSLLARLLSTILIKAHYDVMTAVDGAQAFDMLQSYTPDLILLDLYLPRLNGWDFVVQYHQLPGEHAPIVVVSVAPVDSRPVAGIAAFIQKPFVQINLLQTIQRILSPN